MPARVTLSHKTASLGPHKTASRGESAKGRLLAAGLKLFARAGFEGASTRELAKEAKVNIAAIPYYFGDKEGLYRATLEHIADIIHKGLTDEALAAGQVLSRKNLTEDDARAVLHGILKSLIGFLLSGKITSDITRLFLREQLDPSPSFGALYETTMRPMHEMATRLVARLTGLPFPSERATLCTHALLGQIIVFKTHQEAALRRLGWTKIGPKENAKITSLVTDHTDMLLVGYKAQKKGGAR